MNLKHRISICGFLAVIAVATVLFTGQSAEAQGFSPKIILRGVERSQVKSMPIEMRPNRPFHIYGNTIRRSYHRQSSGRVIRSRRGR